VGQDLLWTGAGLLNYPVHFLGCPIEDNTTDSPRLVGTVVRGLDSVSDLDMDKVVDHPTMQAILLSHHLVADGIGKETLIMSTQWGPFTVASRIVGIEALMMAAVEMPDKLFDLMAFTTELVWRIGEQTLNHPDILGMNVSEPVASGDMISPALFRKFVAPFLKDLVNKIKGKGKFAGIHICGDSTPILQDILELAPTCFSLESKVDLRAARQKLGGKVCVLGNVSPTGKLLSGSPREVKEEAIKCVKAWGDTQGYILTVGCDFPKQVPLENVTALMELKSFRNFAP